MDQVFLPKVSIIVTTYERPESLKGLCYALSVQAHTRPEDFEVIILNDGTAPAVYEKVLQEISRYPYRKRFLNYDRLPDNRPNSYALKNAGAEMAENELLWFLGDDNVVDDHTLFILRLYHTLIEKKDLVLIPHVANLSDIEPYQGAFKPRLSLGPDQTDRCLHYVSFDGLSMRRSTFDQVSIDETFSGAMGFADLDWGHRLWLAGFTMLEVDGVQILQDDSETGSLRDRMLRADEARGDAHRNGRRFIEKWGPETAALYGVVWDEEDQSKYGWVYNEYTHSFDKVGG